LQTEDNKKPYITIVLVAINAIVFIFSDLIFYRYTDQISAKLAMNPIRILEYKEYWRLLTAMFYHFGIEHIMSNMLMLVYFGSMLEQKLGKPRFLLLYFISGLVADFVSIFYNSVIVKENAYTVLAAGASGAISGLFGAVAALVLFCYGKITIMRKKDLPVFLFFALFVGFFDSGVDNFAHLGGFVAGAIFGCLYSAHVKRTAQG